MRCYRCGAWMSAGLDTCPECGFFLQSPVEIRMYKGMKNIRIYDNEKKLLWSGDETGTAYIDLPERRNIEICWGPYFSGGMSFNLWISAKNGEAYRFQQKISRMAKNIGDACLVRTRTIPKRKGRIPDPEEC